MAMPSLCPVELLSLWPSQWQYQLVVTIAAIGLMCTLTFAITSLQFEKARRGKAEVKAPPTLPYWIPIVGHTFSVMLDNMKLNFYIAERFADTPVRLKLFFWDLYIITGPQYISSIFKQTAAFRQDNSIRRSTVFRIFGTPPDVAKAYLEDDSGFHNTPLPNSNVEPRNRIGYLIHRDLIKWLSGSGLRELAEKFSANLIEHLETTKEVTMDWRELPDLLGFMQSELFNAATRAFCGEHLFTVYPDLAEDIWEFDKGIPSLAKGIPRWMKPSIYQAQQKAIKGIAAWHEYVRKYVEQHGMPDDPKTVREVFGNDFMKNRFEMWWKMDHMSSNVKGPASDDLSLIWGASGNSIPSAFWFSFHILRSPSLLSNIRKQIEPCISISSNGKLEIDITTLCSNPLLQSAYMETVRLYVSLTMMRRPEESELRVGEWVLPKKSILLIPSSCVHRNQKLWEGIGKASSDKSSPDQSINSFWAERFLKYPEKGSNSGDPVFSAENLTGYWLPFSGGTNICLGRNFAKQEIIGTMALMVTLFDIEILGDENVGEPDEEGIFGFGVMKPKGKVPFKIRRRQS